MPPIEVEPGVRVHVDDVGDGPPVLLVHGWSLGADAWERQIDMLATAGYRAVAMDQRGHGTSDAPDASYDVARLAADVAAVLERLDLRDAAIVGWSLGGLVAVRAAIDHPERIARLVLVAASGAAAARTAAYPFGVATDVVEPRLLTAEHADREAARTAAIRGGFATEPDRALLARLVALSLRTSTAVADACLRTLLRTDQSPELACVAVPVTHIVGTADPTVSLRGVHWAAEQLDSHLVELECGHYPMFELPVAFDAALLTAVASTETGGPVDPRPVIPEGTPA